MEPLKDFSHSRVGPLNRKVVGLDLETLTGAVFNRSASGTPDLQGNQSAKTQGRACLITSFPSFEILNSISMAN